MAPPNLTWMRPEDTLRGSRDDQTPLSYHDGSSWGPLAPWARYLWEVGTAIGGLEPSKEVVARVAVSVPVRSLAALFLAGGFLSARSRRDAFQDALRLPVGTSVIYTDDRGKSYYAHIAAPSTSATENASGLALRLKIAGSLEGRPGKPPAYRYLRYGPGQCTTVRATPKPERLNRVGQRAAPVSTADDPFLRWAVGDVATYVGNSRLDALIVGRSRLLRSEMEAIRLRVGQQEGSLDELIRADDNPAYKGSWHTRFSPGLEGNRPVAGACVFFDGVPQFERNTAWAKNVEWVAILERTHPRFQEACGRFNQLRAGRVEGEANFELGKPPVGIEISFFLDRVAA